ncbi:hypothetical protein, partial [Corynebacterium dentalis]|uniref:hypothetical protein n=1 Tax=Corynebacterium dentalis TaxID=2014528 RepID=UPI002899955A
QRQQDAATLLFYRRRRRSISNELNKFFHQCGVAEAGAGPQGFTSLVFRARLFTLRLLSCACLKNSRLSCR